MANVNSISSNSYGSTQSLYGSKNVLTGLASGMDTETMIQNSVSGYQTKIATLQQSQTKIEWKQDAYRNITDQMNSIIQKYTSYTSKTNLGSNGFFTSAATTTTQGSHASAISATGTAKSDIQIDAVTQLATAARYAVSANALDLNADAQAVGKAIDWSQMKTIGQVKGTLTLKYGSETIELNFDESDTDIDSEDGLKTAIEKKLEEINVKTTKDTVKASDLFYLDVEDGKFEIKVNRTNKADDGSSVYINSVSGNIESLLGASKPETSNIEDKVKNNSFTVKDFGALAKEQGTAEHLVGKTISVTLDGQTKKITIGNILHPDIAGIDTQIADLEQQLEAQGITDEQKESINTQLSDLRSQRAQLAKEDRGDALAADLQSSINKAFGSGRLTVSMDGGLHFDVPKNSGSTIKVESEVGELLGIGKNGVSNYFNTSNTLGDLLSSSALDSLRIKGDSTKFEGTRYFDKDGNQLLRDGGVYYRSDGKGGYLMKDGKKVSATLDHQARYDADGNLFMQEDGEGDFYRVDEKGNFLYDLTINDTSVGKFTKDTALESVMVAINSNIDVGVNVSYSNLTSQFTFTARDTGETGKIEFGDGLAKKLFTVDSAAKKLSGLTDGSTDWSGATIGGVALPGADTLGSGSTLEDLRNVINNAGFSFRIDYNEATDEFSFVSASTGKELEDFNRSVKVGDKTYSIKDLFQSSSSRTSGQDAILKATVNGQSLTLQRASNTVNMDGMSVTLKETFNVDENGNAIKGEAVTFKTSSDADKITDAIKSFVEDVNKLMKDVREAYATAPLKKSGSSSASSYEPLTESDKADMSETAIAAYEEKAKTGLLFGDTDLSQLYSRLLNAIQSTGTDRMDMEAIGLTTTYDSGLTQLSLDEEKLRSALESDPDKVRNVFAKTTEGGSKTNGLMATLKATLNTYGSTSLANPGVLVRKAGTKLSAISLVNNNLQTQLDNITKQIEQWQSRLSDKVDYYTKQFTQLEKLMSTMNNQSSMLSDLMGY